MGIDGGWMVTSKDGLRIDGGWMEDSKDRQRMAGDRWRIVRIDGGG